MSEWSAPSDWDERFLGWLRATGSPFSLESLVDMVTPGYEERRARREAEARELAAAAREEQVRVEQTARERALDPARVAEAERLDALHAWLATNRR